MTSSLWKWVLGLAALGLACYVLLGVAIAVIGVVGVVVFTVIAVSLAAFGMTLKLLLPLVFFVGLGYGLYRFLKARARVGQSAPHYSTGSW